MRTYNTDLGVFTVDDVHDVKIARSFELEGSHQRHDIALLQELVAPDEVVIDAGAHVGTFSVPFARIAKKVYAFEPTKDTFALLLQNLKDNSCANVEAHNKALSDRAHTVVAQQPGNRAGNLFFEEGSGERVPTAVLDAVVGPEEKVGLVKIDVEGMELSVLRGARQLVRRCRPAIFFEVNTPVLRAHGTTRFMLENFFRSNGYALFRILPTEKEPRVARLFTLYQGFFYDCLALPAEQPLPVYMKSIHFLLSQVKRKILQYVSKK